MVVYKGVGVASRGFQGIPAVKRALLRGRYRLNILHTPVLVTFLTAIITINAHRMMERMSCIALYR